MRFNWIFPMVDVQQRLLPRTTETASVTTRHGRSHLLHFTIKKNKLAFSRSAFRPVPVIILDIRINTRVNVQPWMTFVIKFLTVRNPLQDYFNAVITFGLAADCKLCWSGLLTTLISLPILRVELPRRITLLSSATLSVNLIRDGS